MKKTFFGAIILVAIAVVSFGRKYNGDTGNMSLAHLDSAQAQENQMPPTSAEGSALAWPLKKGAEREKKLTFGLYVTPDPQENPIDPPERFTGYHTALDLEILDEEEGKEVPVFAACDGTVLQTGEIAGYGAFSFSHA